MTAFAPETILSMIAAFFIRRKRPIKPFFGRNIIVKHFDGVLGIDSASCMRSEGIQKVSRVYQVLFGSLGVSIGCILMRSFGLSSVPQPFGVRVFFAALFATLWTVGLELLPYVLNRKVYPLCGAATVIGSTVFAATSSYQEANPSALSVFLSSLVITESVLMVLMFKCFVTLAECLLINEGAQHDSGFRVSSGQLSIALLFFAPVAAVFECEQLAALVAALSGSWILFSLHSTVQDYVDSRLKSGVSPVSVSQVVGIISLQVAFAAGCLALFGCAALVAQGGGDVDAVRDDQEASLDDLGDMILSRAVFRRFAINGLMHAIASTSVCLIWSSIMKKMRV